MGPGLVMPLLNPLSKIQKKVQDMEHCSFNESDSVLDVTFDVEEVKHALKCLKFKRFGGPNNLLPEHLKHCGPVCMNWFCKVYSSICDLKQIPNCFTRRVIIPAFKRAEILYY